MEEFPWTVQSLFISWYKHLLEPFVIFKSIKLNYILSYTGVKNCSAVREEFTVDKEIIFIIYFP